MRDWSRIQAMNNRSGKLSVEPTSGFMAEREGFEPSLEFPLNTLSKRAPSTTRPPLLKGEIPV